MKKHGVKEYKGIFFDLDHTLWDYETNSRETLCELFQSYELQSRGVNDTDSFCKQFREVNLALWDLYDRSLITQDVIRRERFKQILEPFNAYEAKLSEDISRDYLERCPQKNNLMPYAEEVLEYLSSRYTLTVVTNGFEEIQNVKLRSRNIVRFFDHIVTSQKAGDRKPSPQIFQYAMNLSGVRAEEVVMVGDNLVTDIGGARGASIATVFFNPERVAHSTIVDHEITCLSQLKEIL